MAGTRRPGHSRSSNRAKGTGYDRRAKKDRRLHPRDLSRRLRTSDDLAHGDHACLIHETESDRRAALGPFVRTGVERGEKVLCLTEASTPSCRRELLPSIAVKKGQLAVMGWERVRGRKATFDADAAIRFLRAQAEAARADGYPGLRAVLEMNWAAHERSTRPVLREFETKLGESVIGSACVILCVYRKVDFPAGVLLDALETHPIVVAGGAAHENFYHLSAEERTGPDPQAAKLRRRLDRLRRHGRAEEELAISEDCLKLAQRAAAAGTWDWDMLTDRVAWADEFYDVFGLEPGSVEPSHENWLALVHPDDRQHTSDATQAAIRERQDLDLEYRTVTPSGAVRWINGRGRVYRDRNRRPTRMVGICIDITEKKLVTEELRRSREELARAQRIAQIGTWEDDLTTGRLRGSDEVRHIFGVDRDPATLERFEALIVPEDLEAFRDHVRSIQREGKPFKLDFRIRRPDGSLRWIHDEADVEVGPAGIPLRVFGVLQDVTDRKLAEEALRKSEEKYRLISENIPVAVYSVLPDQDATSLFVSGRIRDLTGFEVGEFTADPTLWNRILHPEDRERVWGKVAEHRARNIPLDVECRIVTRSGAVKWIAAKANPVPDARGRLARIDGFMEDITERKRAEDALQEQARFLQDMIDSIPNPIFYKGSDGRYLGCNRAFEAYAGKAKGRIVGKTDDELFPAELARTRREKDDELLGTGGTQVYETVVPHPDGSTRDVVLNKATFSKPDGSPGGLVGVMIDVTERKEMEARLRHSQRLEAIGKLAAGIAHDFRNQLTVIEGESDMLLARGGIDEESRGRVEEVVRAVARSKLLTGQLLAFGRKESLRPRLIDLNDLVEELVQPLPRVIGEDVSVSTRTCPTPCVTSVDPYQLEQAILNLVINARHAMPGGGHIVMRTASVELDEEAVRRFPDTAPGKYAVVEVTDTGCGMDEQTLQRIFEPFFTTKEVGKGSGLGLSMVYGFVKQSGGTIEVSSQPGKGTTFRLYFPLVRAGGDQPAPASIAEGLPRGSETILVVEDEDAVRQIVVESLRSLGYDVLEACNAEAAMRHVKRARGTIDLLLTDVVMPRISGVELARCVRRVRPGIPVLLISGYAEDELARRGVTERDAELLTKPFSRKDLARKVRQILDGAARAARPAERSRPAGGAKTGSRRGRGRH